MTPVRPIRVLLIESHEILRYSLALSLGSFDDLAIVGEAEDGEQGLALYTFCQPDVILVGRFLPGLDGLTFTQRVTQTYPHIKVIVWSTFEQPGDQELALRAGASRYLLKNMSIDDLAEAIRAVSHGDNQPCH